MKGAQAEMIKNNQDKGCLVGVVQAGRETSGASVPPVLPSKGLWETPHNILATSTLGNELLSYMKKA